MPSLEVLVLYNQPLLASDHPDWTSEAGVLESVEAVSAALERHGHRARRLALGLTLDELLAALAGDSRPDVVFNLCEGFAGAAAGEPFVAGFLELMQTPYTGSPPDCLALVRQKARTKWLLHGAGLPTPAFHLVTRDGAIPRETIEPDLRRGALIVKPAGEDASLGIGPASVVQDYASLARQVEDVRQRYGDVLVEQFIAGREFNVGVIAVPEPQVLPLAEIEFAPGAALGHAVVTYDAKWTSQSDDYVSTPVRCPAEVEPALADELRRVALAAFQLTGCRDYGRVDLRVDAAGRPFILEVNANPDLAPTAGLARAVAAAGIAYDDFVVRMVETAHGRRVSS
jgi:D-alanine-D-alanine ligase